jgi:hypothetical protein
VSLDLEIENKQASGLYDPGANITCTTLKFIKTLNQQYFVPKSYRFRTMSGEDRVVGITFLNVKIFNITKRIRVFVVDENDYKYDLLIGLDSIPTFRLNLDYNLRLTQTPENSELVKQQINETVCNRNPVINERIVNNIKNSEKTIEINWNE